MSEHIDAHQQRLIIEKLARSTDSLTSTHRFNEEHGLNIGEKSMHVHDFARTIKGTHRSHEIESAIHSVTGHKVDLETLD